MEELLNYVEQKIEELRNARLNTMDDDGNEIDCYDGEGIYEDGRISGKFAAYVDIKNKINSLSAPRKKIDLTKKPLQ